MADKPKRKYIRRTVKKIKPEKDPDDIQGFTESVGRGKSAIFRKDDVGVLHENTNESYYSFKPESTSEYYLVFVGDHYEYGLFCTKLTFDFQYFPHHVSHGDHETMKYIILVEHK